MSFCPPTGVQLLCDKCYQELGKPDNYEEHNMYGYTIDENGRKHCVNGGGVSGTVTSMWQSLTGSDQQVAACQSCCPNQKYVKIGDPRTAVHYSPRYA